MEVMKIQEEIEFWKGFVKSERFKDNWESNERNPELQEEVYCFLLSHKDKTMLDVGSGVISLLYGAFPNVIAADPLVDYYAEFYQYKHGKPRKGDAESIDIKADIVHISNALDHSQDPKKAILNLYEQAKEYLIIQTFENEGMHEGYSGLHQYNLFVKDNSLVCTNEQGHIIFDSQELGIKTHLIIKKNRGKEWIIFIAEK